MDVSKILAELRAERTLLDEVIANLERMSGMRRRGRPRKSAASAGAEVGGVDDATEAPAEQEKARAAHSA